MQLLFRTGFLMAKYCIYCIYIILEKQQDLFRTMDYVHNKAANSVIGKMVILPSSFPGSPRAIQQSF